MKRWMWLTKRYHHELPSGKLVYCPKKKVKKVKVKIPFKKRFREPMLKGIKVLTTRTKIMGKPEDVFDAFGATFRIGNVLKVSLKSILDFYEEEGCESPEEFIEVWKQIHPRKGFLPSQKVYAHFFRKIKVES